MKIMQIVPSFEVGGAETMCAGLCKQLKAMGHRVVAVSLATKHTSITRELESGGVDLRYLDKKDGMDLKCVARLRALIRREKPQIIHTHLFVLKYVALTGTRVPILHTIHNQAEQEAVPLDRKIGGWLFRHERATPVALSHLIQDSVVRLYGLSPEQVPVVCNGIDLSRCRRKESYALRDPVRLIHVGRFFPQKNHEAILEALDILNGRGIRAQVHLYGDGPRMEEIKAKTRAMGLDDQVVFEGITDNVFAPLQRADLFLLPSKWEGIPMTVIEAMGTGLPVIASDVGGLKDMITPYRTGMLIAPTGAALAQAIETLVSDDETRAAMGRLAAEASNRFRVEEMARRYECLYKEKGREA